MFLESYGLYAWYRDVPFLAIPWELNVCDETLNVGLVNVCELFICG